MARDVLVERGLARRLDSRREGSTGETGRGSIHERRLGVRDLGTGRPEVTATGRVSWIPSQARNEMVVRRDSTHGWNETSFEFWPCLIAFQGSMFLRTLTSGLAGSVSGIRVPQSWTGLPFGEVPACEADGTNDAESDLQRRRELVQKGHVRGSDGSGIRDVQQTFEWEHGGDSAEREGGPSVAVQRAGDAYKEGSESGLRTGGQQSVSRAQAGRAARTRRSEEPLREKRTETREVRAAQSGVSTRGRRG